MDDEADVLTDAVIAHAIRNGATPGALERAIVENRSRQVSERSGMSMRTLQRLRDRWGITRDGAKRAYSALHGVAGRGAARQVA